MEVVKLTLPMVVVVVPMGPMEPTVMEVRRESLANDALKMQRGSDQTPSRKSSSRQALVSTFQSISMSWRPS